MPKKYKKNFTRINPSVNVLCFDSEYRINSAFGRFYLIARTLSKGCCFIVFDRIIFGRNTSFSPLC